MPWWLACAVSPSFVVAEVPGGLEVRATAPVVRLEVRLDGEAVALGEPAVPTERLLAPLSPARSTSYELVATFASGAVLTEAHATGALPVTLEVEAPRGRAPLPVVHGQALSGLGPPQAEVLVRATALEATTVVLGGRTFELGPGALAEAVVPAGPVSVWAGGVDASFVVALEDPGPLAERVRVVHQALPADRRGRPDPTLPADRVVVPGPMATWLERTFGLGFRPRHELAPWTFAAVTLESSLDRPLDVALDLAVTRDGRSVPAFASPNGSAPMVVVRVPPGGEVTASLPLWVDPAVAVGVYQRQVTVRPLGSDERLPVAPVALVVERSGGWVEAGFAASVAAAFAGFGLVVFGGRRYLAAAPVRELVTVALFGSATFVVGSGFQLVGLGVAAALGPFAPFVSGLPDDAFRAVLLATLLTTCPRPGVLGAATVVGFLMRGLALGSFHPADLAYVGASVALHEGSAFAVGLTRDAGWRDASPVRRWCLLSAAFAPANAVSVALGLASTAVLYRLWWAPGYAAAIVLIPGFLYVLVGCALAVPFADGLRRVAP